MNISESTRQDIIDYLLMSDHPFHGKMGIVLFLNRIWDLSSLPSTDIRYSNMAGDTRTHMEVFDDWTYQTLLYDSRLNLLRGHDNIFIKFIENCVHPLVIYKEEYQDELVQIINNLLSSDDVQLEKSSVIDRKTVYKIISTQMNPEGAERKFDVALSFAGEDREIVKQIAEDLKEHSISFFYDEFNKKDLWGKNLDKYFKSAYAENTRFVIPFISEHYPNKDWTNFEFSIARAESKKRDSEFILPVRIDDTTLVGLPDTVAHLDYNVEGKDGIVEAIISKLET